MSLESVIEKRIREAIERGEFDNLPGKGKRLDLDAYFNTPEDLRAGYSILKSNNFIPEEVHLLKEIGELKQKAATVTEEERTKLASALREKELALRLILERNARGRR